MSLFRGFKHQLLLDVENNEEDFELYLEIERWTWTIYSTIFISIIGFVCLIGTIYKVYSNWVLQDSGDDGKCVALLKKIVYHVGLLLHWVDMLSDITYFIDTPIYNTGVLVSGLVFMILPILLFASYAYKADSERYPNKLSLFFNLYLNTGLCCVENWHEGQTYGMENYFLLLEDGPQFIIQTFNSLAIGRQFSLIQILSPIG